MLVRTVPFLLAIALLTALWIPTWWTPFGRDQGLWATIADQVLRGGAPYADGITLKPPGIVYLYAAVLGLWRDMRAIRLLELTFVAATLACMIALFPQRRRWVLAPLLALLLGIAHFHALTYWQLATPDVLLALPVMAAFWAQQSRHPRSPAWNAVLIGTLLGCAFWLKYTALLFVPFFAVLELRAASRSAAASPGSVFARLSLGTLGFLLPTALVLGGLAVGGAFSAFREVQLDYLLGYAGYGASLPTQELPWQGVAIGYVLARIASFAWTFPFLVLPCAVSVLARARCVSWPIWAGCGAAFLSIAVQKKFFLSHWAPVLPWLCLGAALSFAALGRRLWSRANPVWRRDLAILGVSVLMILVLAGLSARAAAQREVLRGWFAMRGGKPAAVRAYLDHFGAYGEGDFSFLADQEVSEYLRTTTRSDDRLFVWGFEPLVYFLADRRPASRFLSATTVISPAAKPAWRQELVEELRENPPAVFLVVSEDEFGFLHGISGDSREMLSSVVPELGQWLTEKYLLETQIEHFTVWRRRRG